MITVQKAQKIVRDHLISFGQEELQLIEAFGRVLSQSVISPYDHPFFDQSAVDGYAIQYRENIFGKPIALETAEIQAGQHLAGPDPEKAVRIFTGAMVPEVYDTIVMQERCSTDSGMLQIEAHQLVRGQNVRKRAEQIREGEVLLEKGTLLNASAIGLLASLGVQKVWVSKIPRVNILATGGEFMPSGERLVPGKIYQSNGAMLQAALRAMGIPASTHECEDDAEALIAMVHRLAGESDVLLITGGVSVGDYDFTPQAISENGYEILFHKVSQKPGKPFLFARKKDAVIFGLPGNPRSVMMIFYVYIRDFLLKSMGSSSSGFAEADFPISHEVQLKGDRDEFLAVSIVNGQVEVLKGQNSHMLKSLAEADGVAHFTPGSHPKGEHVRVMLLKGN